MTTIRTAKSSLRKQIKLALKSLSEEEKVEQSATIVKKLLSNEIYKRAQSVSIFLSMPDEVRTIDIVKDIVTNKGFCFIPHYTKDTMKMVRLHSMEEYNMLPETSWKIKQPLQVAEDALDTVGLDLIIMPGLAFTASGDRLGRGKGYYDNYLQKCIERGMKPSTIALAYHLQIVTSIPTTSTDIPADLVLTSD